MNFDVKDFVTRYHMSGKFVNTAYFAEFLKDVQNDELMEHIRFCNDVHKIPPVLSYVRYRRDIYSQRIERREDRQALGTCFGYLYQFGEYAAHYTPYSSVGINISTTKEPTGITKPSYFPPRAERYVPHIYAPQEEV